jgi:hypothetical protein
LDNISFSLVCSLFSTCSAKRNWNQKQNRGARP